MASKIRTTVFHPAILCAIALTVCVIAAHPVLEMGLNDDWSYIWIARTLANTGHIVYNGWATPMLGWQLYLGALSIKLFGFTFTAVRSSMLLVSLSTAVLLQRLFTRLGIAEGDATVATLTLVLSPLFLPLAFSFMSDVPGFFSILLCCYLCVRAVQASEDSSALIWLAIAAASNVAAGTSRQFAWLGALVMVPCAAWYMRRRRGALLTGAASWILSFLAILLLVHWFTHQPYSISDKFSFGSTDRASLVQRVIGIVRNSFAICLLLLPVLIAFAVKFPLGNARARRQVSAAGVLIVLATIILAAADLVFAHKHESLRWLTPFSNNYVTARGLIDIPSVLGQRPDVVPPSLRIVLIALICAALAGLLLCLWNTRQPRAPLTLQLPVQGKLPWSAVLILLGPYALAYIGMLVIRDQIYDRYLLPVLFVLLVLLVRFYEERVASRLPPASLLLIVLFAAFGVAGMHDLYAINRARLAAAEEVRSAGVPRREIRAGFEYDSWTQLEETGYVNDSRLISPRGAYQPRAVADVSDPCVFWFGEHLTALTPRYGLAYEQTPCFKQASFPPVPYTTWLPPRRHAIYIETLLP
ncbi:MAG TPA: hypothetical protein VGD59_00800 [Acidisarcina sp.]